MNYQRIHDQIIDRAREQKQHRKTMMLEDYENNYHEKHHITPRCMGGTNEDDNIVYLTAREHFLIHWLLHEIHPESNKLTSAFFLMCHAIGDNDPSKNKYRYTPSSRVIAYARTKSALSKKGVKTWITGKKHREETKIKMSISKIGKVGANTGKKFSEEWKNKMKESAKTGWEKRRSNGNARFSEETRAKMRASHTGKAGHKHTEETKRKMRESQTKRRELEKNN